MPTKFYLTNTELRLKRERMLSAFSAGREALEALNLPYFLAYASAQAVLRDGQFHPHEDSIHLGIYGWDLASLQRSCSKPTADERDRRIQDAFKVLGFEPASEIIEESPHTLGKDLHLQGPDKEKAKEEDPPKPVSCCPRVFTTSSWSPELALPTVYKFTHDSSVMRVQLCVFWPQFGCLWDFADDGAETSSGWRYKPFAPQPVQFEGVMTFTMPEAPLLEHYGREWHVPTARTYAQILSLCENRCQVLRVHPFDLNVRPLHLPDPLAWEDYREDVRVYRLRYAKARLGSSHELPPQQLDLAKPDTRPGLMFVAAETCKEAGNELMRCKDAKGAMEKYEEGLYILSKVRDVLLTWRLFVRSHYLKKVEQHKKRFVGIGDDAFGPQPPMPREFVADEIEERNLRTAMALNAAQAALAMEDWDVAEARADVALVVDPCSTKGLYRRAMARLGGGRPDAAKADFLSLLKVTNFGSREATCQLKAMLPLDRFQRELKQLKAEINKEQQLGGVVKRIDEDKRITLEEGRRARYTADNEQRANARLRPISFDEWVEKYEWRYDVDARMSVRKKWGSCFNALGPAPLPIEDWEIDYLTHKEVGKIQYQHETDAMAAKRLAKEGPTLSSLPQPEGFQCKLELDAEDEAYLKSIAVSKGYHYWW